MARPNLRFSITVFGTVLIYTIANWIIPELSDHASINLPLLVFSLAGTIGVALMVENRNGNAQ